MHRITGYPCQPFSIAGRRKGADDPRHLWPHVARIIGECAPEWVFLENVANHLNLGYREVRGELESLGFRVTEGLFTAAEVGAPHRRQRLFILADAERGRRRQPAANPDPQGQPLRPPQRQESAPGPGPGGPDVADADNGNGRPQFETQGKRCRRSGFAGERSVLGDAHGQRRIEAERRKPPKLGSDPSGERLDGGLPAFPPGPDDGDGWKRRLRLRPGQLHRVTVIVIILDQVGIFRGVQEHNSL